MNATANFLKPIIKHIHLVQASNRPLSKSIKLFCTISHPEIYVYNLNAYFYISLNIKTLWRERQGGNEDDALQVCERLRVAYLWW